MMMHPVGVKVIAPMTFGCNIKMRRKRFWRSFFTIACTSIIVNPRIERTDAPDPISQNVTRMCLIFVIRQSSIAWKCVRIDHTCRNARYRTSNTQTHERAWYLTRGVCVAMHSFYITSDEMILRICRAHDFLRNLLKSFNLNFYDRVN